MSAPLTTARFAARMGWHHRRRWAGLIAIVALTASLLGGGLLVGRTLHATLQAQAEQRAGPVSHVIAAGELPLGADLADRLSAALDQPVHGLLSAPASAGVQTSAASTRRRAVMLRGLSPSLSPPPPGTVRVSPAAAAALSLAPGDVLQVRAQAAQPLSSEAALTVPADTPPAFQLVVHDIGPAQWPTTLALRATPDSPLNLIVDATWLAEQLGTPGRISHLLVQGSPPQDRLADALQDSLRLTDVGVQIEHVPDGLALNTSRVLLPPALVRAASQVPHPTAQAIVWMVDGLTALNPSGSEGASSAYAFVGAAPLTGPAAISDWLPDDLAPDQIVLTDPLARRLNVQAGDTVRLDYPTVGHQRTVVPAQQVFTVRSVLPVTGALADPQWMPPLQGVAQAESCSDWDPGLPLALDRITEADEAWWDAHQGTPQAWIGLDAGRAAWGNPWGDTTSVRVPDPALDPDVLATDLLAQLDPFDLGLIPRALGAELRAAATPANDFGSLFLGFQFVLLASAAALASGLVRLAVRHRRPELAALRAMGWPVVRVRQVWMLEAAGGMAVAAAVGAVCALGVAEALVMGLNGAWSAAVSGTTLHAAHSLPAGSVVRYALLGAGLAWASGMATWWWGVRDAVTAPVRHGLVGHDEASAPATVRGRAMPAVSALLVAAGLGLPWLLSTTRSPATTAAFFVAGGAVLVGGIGLLDTLWRTPAAPSARVRSWRALGIAGSTTRRRRSVLATTSLALGVFLVLGVGLGAGPATPDPADPTSGTGGFAWWMPTALPLASPLDTPEGQAAWALPQGLLSPGQAVPVRVLEGDDASCQHLGSAQQPVLYGVPPDRLTGRFRHLTDTRWADLASATPGRLPAFGDVSTVTWGLHAAVGDVLDFTAADGSPLQVEIIGLIDNSVFQGGLLVDSQALVAAWPDQAPVRLTLLDRHPQGPAQDQAIAEALSFALTDMAPDPQPAAERLASFAAVERTYIQIFASLGALGLLLGTVGVAVVVFRNTDERRAELAMLRAIGISRGHIVRLLLAEHGLILGAGVLLGTTASVLGLLPQLRAPGAQGPWQTVLTLAGSLLLLGGAGVALAAWRATQDLPARVLAKER